MNKVAVLAGASTKYEQQVTDNIEEMLFQVNKAVLDKAGVNRTAVDAVIVSSSDYWTGISCTDAYGLEAVGGCYKDVKKIAEDSLLAFIYGCLRLLGGNAELVLVSSFTKHSEVPSRNTLTHLYSDPFIQRPTGIEDLSAAALQAKLYMHRYGITEEQISQVAHKNFNNGMLEASQGRGKNVEMEEILASAYLASPLREGHCAVDRDGACAVLLASEKKVQELGLEPVWVKGVGWNTDYSYFGDRDLLNGSLIKAAQQAYKMAGIVNPGQELDVAELCEPYAYQELLWYEQLGFCRKGEGGAFLDSGVTALEGELPVNPSGGVLSANLQVARGLDRAIEAFKQVKQEAGNRQIKNVKNALAHSSSGLAGQQHVVAILGQ